MTALIGILIVCLIGAAIAYAVHWERRKQNTRSDDQIKQYSDYLSESPDHKLPDADTKFVETLFTARLKGELDRKLAPVIRRQERLQNRFLIRALQIEEVDRFRAANPDKLLPPELLAIAQREGLPIPPQQLTPTKETDTSATVTTPETVDESQS